MGLLGAGPGPASCSSGLTWPPQGALSAYSLLSHRLISPSFQEFLFPLCRLRVSLSGPPFLPCLRPVSLTRFRSFLKTTGTTIFEEFPSLKGFLGLMESSLDGHPYKEEDETWPGAGARNPAGDKHSDTKDQYLGLLNFLS